MAEIMEKIASFKINHLKLKRGLYISRLDKKGDCAVTTFDLRMREPNAEPVMDMPAIHTIEHLGATWLRNGERAGDIVYFGPMGCRTGFYLIVFGEQTPENILPLVTDMCDFILGFEGEIPGAKPDECGNFSEQNLDMAKYYIKIYRRELQNTPRFTYPE